MFSSSNYVVEKEIFCSLEAHSKAYFLANIFKWCRCRRALKTPKDYFLIILIQEILLELQPPGNLLNSLRHFEVHSNAIYSLNHCTIWLVWIMLIKHRINAHTNARTHSRNCITDRNKIYNMNLVHQSPNTVVLNVLNNCDLYDITVSTILCARVCLA